MMPSGVPEENKVSPTERRGGFTEQFGGPLKPNDFRTSRPGIDEVKPILERLNVHHKISLLTTERPLGDGPAVPAEYRSEYRIEIMDPNAPEMPAPESYVQFVFDTLKESGIPISRAAPQESE